MTSIPLHLSRSLAVVAAELREMQDLLDALGAADGEYLHHVVQTLLGRSTNQLRPTVALLTARAAVGAAPRRVLQFAAVVHMVHTAALSHQQTRERRARTDLDEPGGSGNIMVLAGDYLYAQAAYLTAGLHDLSVMSLLASTIQGLCKAEALPDQLPGSSAMPGMFSLSAAGSAQLVGCASQAVTLCARYGALLDDRCAEQHGLSDAEAAEALNTVVGQMQHVFEPGRARDALIDVLAQAALAPRE